MVRSSSEARATVDTEREQQPLAQLCRQFAVMASC
jgi:hypothetical protein